MSDTAPSADLLNEMLAVQMWANAGIVQPRRHAVELTAQLSARLFDELANAYAEEWFQIRARKCVADAGKDTAKICEMLMDVVFDVQKPILRNWGFPGDGRCRYDLGAILWGRSSEDDTQMPDWLRAKREKCLLSMCGWADAKFERLSDVQQLPRCGQSADRQKRHTVCGRPAEDCPADARALDMVIADVSHGARWLRLPERRSSCTC
eukprot:TRINITY_DN107399_c0_g1_i1.p1 TRINITY_DN107399_c0_g1~~TRINITY_DN107399_c0_g1_i1.p1  ORF type:complete len:208 (+),score=43.33 TRINITY_DN107399_c0_g1_i1:41-664(+)